MRFARSHPSRRRRIAAVCAVLTCVTAMAGLPVASADSPPPVAATSTPPTADAACAAVRRAAALPPPKGRLANYTDENLDELPTGDNTGANFLGAFIQSGAVVRGSFDCADFNGATLLSIWAPWSDFTRAGFVEAYVLHGVFAHGSFAHADFRRAYLVSSNFSGADLRSADFRGAYLDGVNFTNANLTGANLDEARHLNVMLHNTICPNGLMSEVGANAKCNYHP